MEPTAIGGKVASGLLVSLLKKVFPADGPGAGLVPKPVRLGGRVSLGGEKRQLGERELRRLATHLVEEALATPGEPPFAHDEGTAVTEALTRRLLALGEIGMDAVQSAGLDERELAGQLVQVEPKFDGLSADADLFLERATGWACGQIIEFFSRRSTFVARTVVEQSRAQARTAAGVEELLVRTRRPDTLDRDFETSYLSHLAKKHGRLTIYGIDLTNSPGRWPLDAAYLSLEAVRHDSEPLGSAFGTAPAKPVRVPADEALAGHDRVLLRGVAGSGKTTLVQWLAVSAASGATGRVPFVLPLRTLTRHGEQLPSPARFLTAVGCPLDGAQPKGWEDRVLASGRALVLIDGLDEVPERERERARGWLRDLTDAYPGNHWLLTSRPSAVDDEWLADEGFTELVLAAMSPSDVASFIHRWHGAASAGVPEEDELLASYCAQLLDAVRTKPDLGRLATNPLMCGLICALHRDRRGYLPHGRKELYESALSMLLTRRDRERDMAVPELSEEPQLQHGAGPGPREIRHHGGPVGSSSLDIGSRAGPRSRLTFIGKHPLSDLLRVLPPGVRKIGLSENYPLQDLRPLTSLHSLDRVGFRACPQVDDLSPLMDLNLTELYVRLVNGVSGLERLNTLRELTVMTELPAELRNLPRNASLRTLRLDASALMVDGLRGLSDWPTLKQLDLRYGIESLGGEDWSELAGHPSLDSLSIPAGMASRCADAPELPGIETWWVTNGPGRERVRGRLPGRRGNSPTHPPLRPLKNAKRGRCP
ncbi:NACHT domain-containing protein [Streptomyces sp. SID2999]|uniref:NACHT N-terminal Helical domain 1-containing protein n=1 Tax=Streptomyces sp. SID2999 TaxID=2690258 RepID=UPI001F296E85|nr:NACHT domain-containing protein [Streptomyces sp. SID2999]